MRRVSDALTAIGHKVTVAKTVGPNSASGQAGEFALLGVDVVFACGGDGTVNEVLQGLVKEGSKPSCALGIIPLGSANALARCLGLSLDPVRAAIQQLDGKTAVLPVGKVVYGSCSRYFTVMAGAGPDGALVYELMTAQKSTLGRLAYYIYAARLFFTRWFYRFHVDYRVACGRRTTITAVCAMALRVKDLGGLFNKLAPRNGSIHDTDLQLLILRPPGLLSLPLWFASGWLNLHRLNPFLQFMTVRDFSCRPMGKSSAHFQADGEWLGRVPIEVSVLPNAIRMLVPDDGRPSGPQISSG